MRMLSSIDNFAEQVADVTEFDAHRDRRLKPHISAHLHNIYNSILETELSVKQHEEDALLAKQMSWYGIIPLYPGGALGARGVGFKVIFRGDEQTRNLKACDLLVRCYLYQ